MRKWLLPLIVGMFLIFSFGCCAPFSPSSERPDVMLASNLTEGTAPFDPTYTYHCFDPDDQLQSCALKIDGRVFASAADQKGLLPQGYVYPDFYYEALNTPGVHVISIIGTTTDGQSASQNVSFTVRLPPNRPPVVNLILNLTEGPSPFYPRYRYVCYDPENALASCEIRLDGRTFTSAQEPNASLLFPDGYAVPEFYDQTVRQMGPHNLTIIAADKTGLISSKTVGFTVLRGASLDKPGWYTCNGVSNHPCDIYQEAYCGAFTPLDLDVRRAAAAAIVPHPGAFSVNQLLDIYDYVRKNVPYQNVPVNLTYQPYLPHETLSTKSGDCKNQAVLLASMVEAIGGSARVLLIPDCSHAYAEVYMGSRKDIDALSKAVFAHYSEEHMSVNWHYTGNETENWLVFDTAGGQYPGQTLPKCMNVSQTFVMYDCNRERVLNAPQITGIEYGPFPLYSREMVIDPGYWQYFTYSNDRQYSFCNYNFTIQSLSQKPFSWYIIPAGEYDNFKNFNSYSSYYRAEQVQSGNHPFGWTTSDGEFRLIIYNKGDSSITVKPAFSKTCYID